MTVTRQITPSAAGTVSFLRVPANAVLPRNYCSAEKDSKNKRGVAAGQAAGVIMVKGSELAQAGGLHQQRADKPQIERI